MSCCWQLVAIKNALILEGTRALFSRGATLVRPGLIGLAWRILCVGGYGSGRVQNPCPITWASSGFSY